MITAADFARRALAFLRRYFAPIVAVVIAAYALAKAYAAGKRKALTESIAKATKQRAQKAVRYEAKAQAEITEANREARRREAITKPDRGDWDELRRLNERLDDEDKRGQQ